MYVSIHIHRNLNKEDTFRKGTQTWEQGCAYIKSTMTKVEEKEDRKQKGGYEYKTKHKPRSARNTGRKTGREESIHTRHRLLETGKQTRNGREVPFTRKKIRELPDSVESVGHIQCYCTVLQLSRIAIWRELIFSIRKSSTELNIVSEPRWHFPSALSPEAHAEWGLYKILEYMGLHEILPPGAGQNRAKLRKDIEKYHTAYGITDIDTPSSPRGRMA